MRSFAEMEETLLKVCQELEELRRAEQEQTAGLSFEQIAQAARQYPINGHPLEKWDEYLRETYLTMLMAVAAQDTESLPDTVLFIGRIAAGAHYNDSMESLYLRAQKLKPEDITLCSEVSKYEQLRLFLTLECSVLVCMFKGRRDVGYSLVAQIAMFLTCTREEVTFLSNFARVIVTQDLNEYHCDIKNEYPDMFDCYLKQIRGLTWSIVAVDQKLSSDDYLGKTDEAKLNVYTQSGNGKIDICFHAKHKGWVSSLNSEIIKETSVQIKEKYFEKKPRWKYILAEGYAVKTVTAYAGFSYSHPLIYGKAKNAYQEAIKGSKA